MKISIKYILFFCAVSLMVRSAEIRAESFDFDLDILLHIAEEQNPKLQEIEEKIRSIDEKYSQAEYLDALLKQYNAFTKQLKIGVGKPHHKEMIEMKFPFPNALELKNNLIGEEQKIAEQELELAKLGIFTEIKLIYLELLFIESTIKVHRKNVSLLAQIVESSRAKYRAGLGTYGNLITLQIEKAKLDNAIDELEDRRKIIHARLNKLLSRPIDAKFSGMPQAINGDFELTETSEELRSLAMGNNPKILRLRSVIRKMELMVKLAKRMTFPDLTLGTSSLNDRAMPSANFPERPMSSIGNSAKFALRNSYIREIEVKILAMKNRLKSLEESIGFAVEKFQIKMETAERSIELHRQTLIPQAEQALEVANTAYQTTAIDFISLLDAQRTLLKFQLSLEKLIFSFRKNFVSLEKSIGIFP